MRTGTQDLGKPSLTQIVADTATTGWARQAVTTGRALGGMGHFGTIEDARAASAALPSIVVRAEHRCVSSAR